MATAVKQNSGVEIELARRKYGNIRDSKTGGFRKGAKSTSNRSKIEQKRSFSYIFQKDNVVVTENGRLVGTIPRADYDRAVSSGQNITIGDNRVISQGNVQGTVINPQPVQQVVEPSITEGTIVKQQRFSTGSPSVDHNSPNSYSFESGGVKYNYREDPAGSFIRAEKGDQRVDISLPDRDKVVQQALNEGYKGYLDYAKEQGGQPISKQEFDKQFKADLEEEYKVNAIAQIKENKDVPVSRTDPNATLPIQIAVAQQLDDKSSYQNFLQSDEGQQMLLENYFIESGKAEELYETGGDKAGVVYDVSKHIPATWKELSYNIQGKGDQAKQERIKTIARNLATQERTGKQDDISTLVGRTFTETPTGELGLHLAAFAVGGAVLGAGVKAGSVAIGTGKLATAVSVGAKIAGVGVASFATTYTVGVTELQAQQLQADDAFAHQLESYSKFVAGTAGGAVGFNAGFKTTKVFFDTPRTPGKFSYVYETHKGGVYPQKDPISHVDLHLKTKYEYPKTYKEIYLPKKYPSQNVFAKHTVSGGTAKLGDEKLPIEYFKGKVGKNFEVKNIAKKHQKINIRATETEAVEKISGSLRIDTRKSLDDQIVTKLQWFFTRKGSGIEQANVKLSGEKTVGNYKVRTYEVKTTGFLDNAGTGVELRGGGFVDVKVKIPKKDDIFDDALEFVFNKGKIGGKGTPIPKKLTGSNEINVGDKVQLQNVKPQALPFEEKGAEQISDAVSIGTRQSLDYLPSNYDKVYSASGQQPTYTLIVPSVSSATSDDIRAVSPNVSVAVPKQKKDFTITIPKARVDSKLIDADAKMIGRNIVVDNSLSKTIQQQQTFVTQGTLPRVNSPQLTKLKYDLTTKTTTDLTIPNAVTGGSVPSFPTPFLLPSSLGRKLMDLPSGRSQKISVGKPKVSVKKKEKKSPVSDLLSIGLSQRRFGSGTPLKNFTSKQLKKQAGFLPTKELAKRGLNYKKVKFGL